MKRHIHKIVITFFAFCVICAIPFSVHASGMTQFESETLSRVNQYRSKHRLSPLIFDERLQALAREHSAYMLRNRSLGHQNFMSRYSRSGSHGCAENAGWNARTPYEQFTGWRDSAGHKRNMLDRTMRRAGVSKVGSFVTFFVCQ
jgi:uncharacterized protein YkwD